MDGQKNARPAVGAAERKNEIWKKTTDSIPNVKPEVKDLLNLRDYWKSTGLMAQDAAAAVGETFTSFSPQLMSACMSPERYGVVIHPDAMVILCGRFGIALKKRKPKRRMEKGVTVRMTKQDFKRVKQQVKRDGYTSVQAWLHHLVMAALEEVTVNA